MENIDILKGTSGSNSPRSRLKLSDHPNEKCPKCGSELFVTAYVVKDINAADAGMLGKTKDGTVPFPCDMYPIVVCAKCGELAPMMRKSEEMLTVINKLAPGLLPAEGGEK